MINSPLTDKSDLPTYKIFVEGSAIKDAYQVVSIQVEKEINSISSARIILIDGNPADEKFDVSESDDFVPGKEIEIQMGYHATDKPVFKGVIVSQNIKVKSTSNRLRSQLTVKCSDKALKLTVGKKNHSFSDKKDSDIFSSIISGAGLSATVEATAYEYKKLVQYDCTDWDFIVSRAEVNGYMVICDDGALNVGKPELSDDPVLSVSFGVDVIDFQGELNAHYQIEKVSCKSWDGTKHEVSSGKSTEPTLNDHGNITGKKLSEVLGSQEVIMQTSVPEDSEVLKSWANAKLQKSRMSKITGSVSFPGHAAPKVGKLIQLKGFGARFNGKAFISKVNHVFEAGTWITTTGIGLNSKWFSESKQIISPSAMGLLPGIQGLHLGIIKQINEDPDGEFRVLVDVPLIDDTGTGIWARLVSGYASEETGIFFLPEVGDEVILGFLNEDPRFPVVIGSLYGKKKKPPYTPESENNTKAIITKSKLKLIFDEEKKDITLETPGGNKIIISDDQKSIKISDQNNNKLELSGDGIVLDSPKDIKLTSKGKFLVDAMEVKVASKKDMGMEGLNVNITAKMGFKAEGSAQAALKASGQVEVKGAMVMIN